MRQIGLRSIIRLGMIDDFVWWNCFEFTVLMLRWRLGHWDNIGIVNQEI
jgi:hypothetical protein